MTNNETIEVSVTLPQSFVENRLLPQYEAAARPSQAVRMSVQSDIERREDWLSPREISDQLMAMIEESGSGRFVNNQRIEVGDALRDGDIVEVGGE